MHKPECILDNGMHNIFWDTEMQTDLRISKDQTIRKLAKKNKTTCVEDFSVLTDHWTRPYAS